jgi:thioredoxin 1
MSELVITAEEFETKVKNGTGAAMVDFFTDWCAPCKVIAPIIEKMAVDYQGKAGVYKINTEKAQSLATRLGIRGNPTIIFFKDGKETDRIVGATSADNLTTKLKKII